MSPLSQQLEAKSSTPDTADVFDPVLAATLDCLDVQLDDELARYRRYQMSQGRPQRRSRGFSGTASTVRSPRLAAPSEPKALASASAIAPATSPSAPASGAIAPDHATLALAHNDQGQLTPNRTLPKDYLESSEELLRSLEEPAPTEPPLTEPVAPRSASLLSSLLTPLGVGSVLLLILSSTTLGYLLLNPSSMGLRSFWQRSESSATADAGAGLETDDNGATSIAPDLSAGEFDALDLGKISTLPPNRPEVLSESTAASTDDPAELTDPADSAAPVDDTAAPTPARPSEPSPTREATAAANPPATPAPASPTTSTSPRQASSTPAPAPASPRPAPQPAPVVRAAPPAPAAPAPAPAQPDPPAPAVASAPAPAAPAADESYYYVVTPYTGDRSLEEAQQAVQGAYVRNFPSGARVQMGAFSSSSGAESLAQELESQGIPAQIYQR